MKMEPGLALILTCSLLFLNACTFNPFTLNNETSGDPKAALVGAAAGAGTVALLGGPKPLMALAGIGGGALGYYVTTMRYDAGGIIQYGGQVYHVGDFLGIEIPTDQLFEANTAEFSDQAPTILNSTAAVLSRYPNNHILISGNTSGFQSDKREQRLSLKRAAKVADYLWNAGINDFKDKSIDMRKLSYVGYGDYFPIASSHHNQGVRQNSRIQITSYRTQNDLKRSKQEVALNNMGDANSDQALDEAPARHRSCYKDEC
jgi:hypothetical protein